MESSSTTSQHDESGINPEITRQSAVALPRRKKIRANFHDYSGGLYFVTICTQDKHHYFGKITNGVMRYSSIGRYCKQQLEQIEKHYPQVEIPLFVVMPNHLHAIVCVNSTNQIFKQRTGNVATRPHEPCGPTKRSALSVVIGGVKRAVTIFAKLNNLEFGWQYRYHDHIIRGVKDGNIIAEYIENNVARWNNDRYFC